MHRVMLLDLYVKQTPDSKPLQLKNSSLAHGTHFVFFFIIKKFFIKFSNTFWNSGMKEQNGLHVLLCHNWVDKQLLIQCIGIYTIYKKIRNRPYIILNMIQHFKYLLSISHLCPEVMKLSKYYPFKITFKNYMYAIVFKYTYKILMVRWQNDKWHIFGWFSAGRYDNLHKQSITFDR